MRDSRRWTALRTEPSAVFLREDSACERGEVASAARVVSVSPGGWDVSTGRDQADAGPTRFRASGWRVQKRVLDEGRVWVVERSYSRYCEWICGSRQGSVV